jgi:hypothetical protein
MMVCVGAHVDVELLVVPECPNAAAAQDLLRSALRAGGLADTPIRVSVIDSERAAEQRGFVGSPTVLISGVDPFAEPGRPPALACRVFAGPAGSSGLPPAGQLHEAVIYAAQTSGREMP